VDVYTKSPKFIFFTLMYTSPVENTGFSQSVYFSSSSLLLSSVTSQALLDLFRPRLTSSSKVFQVVFVHFLYISSFQYYFWYH